jgi:phosphinothricin acetyltransferase
VEIRSADPQRDAEACAAIYAPFVNHSPVSFEEVAPTAEQMARLIEKTSADYPWLVAEASGHLVGYAYACAHRSRSAYRWAADLGLYVAEGHRSQGVGTRLCRALLELLARQGIHVAVVGITLPNPASVALSESLGFEPVGVYRRIGYKAGAWRDVGWWQRELLPSAGGPPPDPGPPVRIDGPRPTDQPGG